MSAARFAHLVIGSVQVILGVGFTAGVVLWLGSLPQ